MVDNVVPNVKVFLTARGLSSLNIIIFYFRKICEQHVSWWIKIGSMSLKAVLIRFRLFLHLSLQAYLILELNLIAVYKS